ncbi:MAG: hypothetical protein ACK2UC_06950 [Anaerolineae bacterium]|jgi:hypothetical protein
MAGLDLQQLETIFYVLLGVIGFTLAVLIIYVVVSNARERAKLAQAYELDSLSPRPALRVAGQILALIREEAGQPLQVEIQGNRYERLSDIEDQQIRRQVIESALELIQFTGVLGGVEVAPAPLEKTYSWREDIRESSQAELSRIRESPPGDADDESHTEARENVEEQFLSLLAAMGQAPSAAERPSLVNALQARWSAKAADQGPPRSFVEDIEGIVQRRIQLIPALAQKQLHVEPGPGGEVRFIFEGQAYERLDDIPNLTARDVVRDSIQEWDETT